MVQFSKFVLKSSQHVRNKVINKNSLILSNSYDMTNVVSIHNHKNAVNVAVELLKQGQLIALPTDTIYGIAADSQNTKALNTLYRLKGRDFAKPIAICVSSVKDISNWGEVEGLPKGILYELFPGPVTVLLRRTSVLNNSLNPGHQNIGIRIPNFSFIQKVTKRFGSIALTSANLSSDPSTLSPEEFNHLWPKLGAVFDGGRIGLSGSREGSTIVDLSENQKYNIVREGSALKETLSILKKYGLKE